MNFFVKVIVGPHVLIYQVSVYGCNWGKGSVLLFKKNHFIFLYVHAFPFYVELFYFYSYSNFSYIWCCYHLVLTGWTCVWRVFLKGQTLCEGRNVIGLPKRAVDIVLDSSVIEHLTSDPGVLDSNHVPDVYFIAYVYRPIPSTHFRWFLFIYWHFLESIYEHV